MILSPCFICSSRATTDAVWLFDPATATVVDCNKAAAALMRCESRADLIGKGAIELSAPEQPDGTHTGEIPAAPHERRRSTRQYQDFGFGGFQKQRTNSEKESLNTNLCEIGFVLDRSGSMKPKLRKRPRSPICAGAATPPELSTLQPRGRRKRGENEE